MNRDFYCDNCRKVTSHYSHQTMSLERIWQCTVCRGAMRGTKALNHNTKEHEDDVRRRINNAIGIGLAIAGILLVLALAILMA